MLFHKSGFSLTFSVHESAVWVMDPTASSIPHLSEDLIMCIADHVTDRSSFLSFQLVSHRFHDCVSRPSIVKKMKRKHAYTEKLFVTDGSAFIKCGTDNKWMVIGDNDFGKLGIPPDNTDEYLHEFTPTPLFDHLPPGKEVVAITGGLTTTCIFLDDGSVYTVGRRLTSTEHSCIPHRVFDEAKEVKPIYKTCFYYGFLVDGDIVIIPPSVGGPVITKTCGAKWAVVLDALSTVTVFYEDYDGRIWTFGSNRHGHLGIGSETYDQFLHDPVLHPFLNQNKPVFISSSYNEVFAKCVNGKWYSWGLPEFSDPAKYHAAFDSTRNVPSHAAYLDAVSQLNLGGFQLVAIKNGQLCGQSSEGCLIGLSPTDTVRSVVWINGGETILFEYETPIVKDLTPMAVTGIPLHVESFYRFTMVLTHDHQVLCFGMFDRCCIPTRHHNIIPCEREKARKENYIYTPFVFNVDWQKCFDH